MREFKSSLFVLVKNFVYSLAGGAVAGLIGCWFLPLAAGLSIGAAIFLLALWLIVLDNHIRAVVDEQHLTIYKGSKVKHQFPRADTHFHARIKTSGGDSDCTLVVTPATGKETSIDCSMLGRSRFYRLLDALGFNDQAPQKLETLRENP